MALVHKDPVLPTFSDSDTKDVRKRKKEELLQFETECEELYNSLKHRFLEALMTSVRASLELLRKKLSVRCVRVTAEDCSACATHTWVSGHGSHNCHSFAQLTVYVRT